MKYWHSIKYKQINTAKYNIDQRRDIPIDINVCISVQNVATSAQDYIKALHEGMCSLLEKQGIGTLESRS